MLDNIKKIFTFVMGLLCFPLAYAETLPSGQINSQLFVQQHCPPVEVLYSEGGTVWKAPEGWASNTPSLDDKVDEFIGAQWIGINVGEIICLYGKHDRNNFPVSLQRHMIVNAPTSAEAWSDDKGGYKNCHSHDITQCSFMVRVETPIKNVYDEIDFFKERAAKG